MSKEKVAEFYETLKADKTLAEELTKIVKESKSDSFESAAKLVVAFASKKGFSFSTEDIKGFETEAREMSPKELDRVDAAGSFLSPSDNALIFFPVCTTIGGNKCPHVGSDGPGASCFMIGIS